jgi:hypothetical protein
MAQSQVESKCKVRMERDTGDKTHNPVPTECIFFLLRKNGGGVKQLSDYSFVNIIQTTR